ncbi:MAG: hypothetical protein WBB70_00625, partial [Desulfobacterales bacterium]
YTSFYTGSLRKSRKWAKNRIHQFITQPGQAGLRLVEPTARREPKIFATKTLKHKGYIYYSFFVPWCLSGRIEKVLPQKAQNLQLRN